MVKTILVAISIEEKLYSKPSYEAADLTHSLDIKRNKHNYSDKHKEHNMTLNYKCMNI